MEYRPRIHLHQHAVDPCSATTRRWPATSEHHPHVFHGDRPVLRSQHLERRWGTHQRYMRWVCRYAEVTVGHRDRNLAAPSHRSTGETCPEVTQFDGASSTRLRRGSRGEHCGTCGASKCASRGCPPGQRPPCKASQTQRSPCATGPTTTTLPKRQPDNPVTLVGWGSGTPLR